MLSTDGCGEDHDGELKLKEVLSVQRSSITVGVQAVEDRALFD